MAIKTDIFYVLQVMRALAAFVVMAGHTTNEAEEIAAATGKAYNYIPYPNAVGVDIFFVISGFVIMYASHHLMGQRGAWKGFIKRRLIRIVPLYWFYTLLLLAAVALVPGAVDTVQAQWSHLIQSFAFIPHVRPIGDSVRPFLSLGWSLNYEMYFYVIFAALLFLPLKRLTLALSLLLGGSVLLGLIVPQDWVILKFWFDPYVLEFLSGALIAYVCVRGWTLPKAAFAPLVILSGTILLVLFFPVQNSIESQLMRFGVGILLVMAACLPAGVASMRPPRILTALGDSSYSLYLSHPFAIGATKVVWTYLDLSYSLWIYVLVTILACLIGGHISYLLIERPSYAFLKKWIKTGSK